MRFKFGHEVAQIMGTVNIRLSQDECSHIPLNILIVDFDIPLTI